LTANGHTRTLQINHLNEFNVAEWARPEFHTTNSVIEIDLSGQANAEMAGDRTSARRGGAGR
jgi:acyl-CoA hydrolase